MTRLSGKCQGEQVAGATYGSTARKVSQGSDNATQAGEGRNRIGFNLEVRLDIRNSHMLSLEEVLYMQSRVGD